MPVFMGPSPLLAWSQVWFKKNQETSCWLRQLCLQLWPLPDSHRDLAWISWNGLSHNSHAVHSPGQMCLWKSFITLCALIFSHFIFLFAGRSTRRTKGLVTFRFILIYLFICFRLLAAMLKKVEMISSDRLSVHWKMGMSFGFGDGGWMTKRKSEEGRRLRSSQDVQYINDH